MKIYKGTVFMDMDGVMADFEGGFCDAFGYDNRNLSNLADRYPNVPKDLIDEFVSTRENYESLLPIFGGAVLLPSILKQRGHYVVILTSRPKHLAEVTKEWLEGYSIEYNEIWYASKKGIAIQEFNEMYPGRKGFLLIDDIVSNFRNLPDGVQQLVWEQPWNEGYFPRMRYNDEKMRLEVKTDTESEWVRF